METYANIRKLRKKLRQIEHLEEIDRDLTDEEVAKCMRKEAVREELLKLLVSYNSNAEESYTSSIVTNDTSVKSDTLSTSTYTDSPQLNSPNIIDTTDIEVEQVETLSVDRLSDKSSQKQGKENTASLSEKLETRATINTGSEKSQTAPPVYTGSSPPAPSKKAAKKKGDKITNIKDEWRSKKFQVSLLESHNDIITAVDACDGLFVSASRDTTVKVWDIVTLTEVRSLGSHTGSVTDVLIIPGKLAVKLGSSFTISENDHLILSGSTDCNLNVWSAETGELLKSVYTFNPITKIAFCPDLSLVATASDGGKLELWDINTKDTVCSETAHSDSITGLCVFENRIYTSCAVDGEIKVFEVRDNKLHCLFASENLYNMTGGAVIMRHVRALGVSTSHIFYGDDGVNLKLLTWKKGLVKKLPNHKEEFGMTDAICCHGNLMMTSAYDLDNGNGYINVFDIS
ncbi:uncharacterized WD repeat-containing protein alr2800-like, partial [Ruditapes philippinarum]|uniref:uncharacterized WD repeat-containing protein alr2800-like n=1 Tax=Ruditapes philippinarum TaxID=129788 RepID=UPI00295BE7D2